MVNGASSLSCPRTPGQRWQIKQLMLFFAIVYVVEGISQARIGIISQPLNYYLKQAGWTPVQITAYLAVLSFPWLIKPALGLVSDLIPIFGSRRKAYLLIANVGAVAAYAWIPRLTTPNDLILPLLVTSYAMAISSTVCGALLVENGQKFHESGTFISQQWLFFNVALMASSLVGGQLVEHLAPASALHIAAIVAAIAPLAAIFGCLFLVDEKLSSANFPELKKTLRSIAAALKNRKLQVIALFLFLYSFSPGFGAPLYFFMTDDLKFTQSYIGMLGSIASAGGIAGALLYRWLLWRIKLKALLQLSIVLSTLATASFLLLRGGADRFCGQLRKRLYDDDRHHFRTHTGRRLLSEAVRGVCICWTYVDHEPGRSPIQQCGGVPL